MLHTLGQWREQNTVGAAQSCENPFQLILTRDLNCDSAVSLFIQLFKSPNTVPSSLLRLFVGIHASRLVVIRLQDNMSVWAKSAPRSAPHRDVGLLSNDDANFKLTCIRQSWVVANFSIGKSRRFHFDGPTRNAQRNPGEKRRGRPFSATNSLLCLAKLDVVHFFFFF